jgi:hypothetical protein
MSRAGLERKLDKALAALERAAAPTIVIRCVYGDEPIELDPGEILIETQWGSGPVDDESGQDQEG